MDDATQAETIAFLTAAGDATPPVATHISRVFFAGERVFKLKRAVRTPYLDFSTPERRLAACERELALNRRTAPALYVAVRRITRQGGALAFDGAGALVDAVVEMRRFDEDMLLDRMVARGALTRAHVEALAARLAAFHADAAVDRARGGAAAMRAVLDINEAAVAQGFLAGDPACARALARSREALARGAAALDRRHARGRTRRCHGDLTLRNICLIDGAPTPFDCLEFDDALATIDVLYDLAFPLMDLWRLGRRDLASALFNRYCDRTAEEDGLGLLPFFVATRALVRAHVAASTARDADGEARAKLEQEARADVALALEALAPAAPRLVAVGGFSGSGKSTVAAALAPRLAPPPGARVLSSDRLRKGLFGVDPGERLPPEAYAPDVSERVYARMRRLAGESLAAGATVVCDAVFDRAAARTALAEVAAQAGAPFAGAWLEAPATDLTARVAARRGDPSDATVDVLEAQRADYAARGETMDWPAIDAAREAGEVARDVAARAGVT